MSENETMRLDKWLWAARFFKTRGIAQKNIELGRINVNGMKAKNSTVIRVGDLLDMKINSLPYKIKVEGLNQQRRPAKEAQLLYSEDEAMIEKRKEFKLMSEAAKIETHFRDGKPSKKDRRDLEKIKRSWN